MFNCIETSIFNVIQRNLMNETRIVYWNIGISENEFKFNLTDANGVETELIYQIDCIETKKSLTNFTISQLALL
jgi:hypothetical protein